MYASLMMLLIRSRIANVVLRYELSVYPAFIAMAALFSSPIAGSRGRRSASRSRSCSTVFALYYWVG